MTRTRLLSFSLEDWPAPDRTGWDAALAPADSLFDDQGGAAERYSGDALRKCADAYGQWLSFLDRSGELDADQAPALRVTAGRLNGWIADQRARGNRSTTIYGRLRDLHGALRLIAPAADLSFILKPGGRSLRRLLRPAPRWADVRDPRELLARALALFDAGRSGKGYAKGAAAVRDAALLGLLAVHAPRIGSIARMDIGAQLRATEDGYRLDFGEKDTKTRRPLTYDLHPELVPVFAHYLDVVRPGLPAARHSARLWIGVTGSGMDRRGLTEAVRRRTQSWFGRPEGPHWFRKCLRSFAADVAPEAALDAATMLGHGPQVSIDHYTKATAARALRRHGARVTRKRRQTWSLAASAFGWRDDPVAPDGGGSERNRGIIASTKGGGR